MNQGSFNRMRLQIAVLLLALPLLTAALASNPSKVIEANFDVHPELEMTLFAEEPLLVNPTNIDVDHLGRVWVCEVLNYRHFRNTDALPRKKAIGYWCWKIQMAMEALTSKRCSILSLIHI